MAQLKKERNSYLYHVTSCGKRVSYMFDVVAEEANGTQEDSVTKKWSQSLMRLSYESTLQK